MKKITISDDSYNFIKSLSMRMKNQYNEHTANPYYITIRKFVTVPVPDGCGTDVMYFDLYQCENYTKDEIKVMAVKSGVSFEEYLEKNFNNIKIYETKEEKVFDNVFLTYEGYKDHVEANGHNIKKTCKSFDSYVKYAYKNTELEMLFKFIHEIADNI